MLQTLFLGKIREKSPHRSYFLRDAFEFLFKLFPNSRNRKENRRSYFSQRMNQRPLQRIFPCKVNRNIAKQEHNQVKILRSNMTQRKVRYDSFVDLPINIVEQSIWKTSLHRVSQVIMSQHDSFWVTSGPTGIYNVAHLTGGHGFTHFIKSFLRYHGLAVL